MGDRLMNRLAAVLTNRFVIVAIGVLLLAVASLLGVPMSNDEGVWGYIGRLWVEDGLLPYRGAIEQKTPFVYLVFALSHLLFDTNIWFPRLLAIAAVAASGLLIYAITRRLSTNRAALFAMAIFLFIMPLSSVDGAFVETETFMNVFRLLAFLSIVAWHTGERTARDWWAIGGAGVFYGLAVACKQIALIDAVPLLCFLLAKNGWQVRRVVPLAGVGILGALLGTLLSVAPLLLSGGTLADYVDGAWIILTQEGLSAGSLLTRVSGFFRHFFNVRLYFLSVGFFGFIVFFRRLRQTIAFATPMLVWAVTEFAAYNLQGFYLDHHYKAFIPSWSILFGVTLSFALDRLTVAGSLKALEAQQRFFTVAVLLGLLVFYVPFETNYYHTVRKYFKGIQDHSFRDLGLFLKDNTSSGDFVYHWGIHNGPVYYYADRNAPSRYFSAYFLKRPGALEEIHSDLQDHPPAFIVVPVELLPPEWLDQFIADRYREEGVRYGHRVYRKL